GGELLRPNRLRVRTYRLQDITPGRRWNVTGHTKKVGQSGLGSPHIWRYRSCRVPSALRLIREAAVRLVDVAPRPRITRHGRSHPGMLRFMEMLGRVLSGRGVAAADMAADLALA